MNVMEWLASNVPLTLLIDLLDERGPASDVLYHEECPDDVSWLAA